MRLPDANLLIYAIDDLSPHHDSAKSWIEESLSGNETVALTWSVLLAFLRITTNPRIYSEPLAAEEALDFIEGWLQQPPAVIVSPTDGHARTLRDLLEPLGTAGNLVADAHLAAIAIEHGADLYSADTDFARFAGLNWINPLA